LPCCRAIPPRRVNPWALHCACRYYPLDISFFKSSLDSHLLALLWNKYWISTLSSSPLIANRDYTVKSIKDLSEKIDQAESQLTHNNRSVRLPLHHQIPASALARPPPPQKKTDSQGGVKQQLMRAQRHTDAQRCLLHLSPRAAAERELQPLPCNRCAGCRMGGYYLASEKKQEESQVSKVRPPCVSPC